MNDLARFEAIVRQGGSISLPGGRLTQNVEEAMAAIGQPMQSVVEDAHPAVAKAIFGDDAPPAENPEPESGDSGEDNGAWVHPWAHEGEEATRLLPVEDDENGHLEVVLVETSRAGLEEMTVADLVKSAEYLGLSKGGRKADIIDRIATALGLD
jgi:hypothetical protein